MKTKLKSAGLCEEKELMKETVPVEFYGLGWNIFYLKSGFKWLNEKSKWCIARKEPDANEKHRIFYGTSRMSILRRAELASKEYFDSQNKQKTNKQD